MGQKRASGAGTLTAGAVYYKRGRMVTSQSAFCFLAAFRMVASEWQSESLTFMHRLGTHGIVRTGPVQREGFLLVPLCVCVVLGIKEGLFLVVGQEASHQVNA